jgi:hypothetical protein
MTRFEREFTLDELWAWIGNKEPLDCPMKQKNTIIAEWRAKFGLRYFLGTSVEDVFVVLPDGRRELIASFDEED